MTSKNITVTRARLGKWSHTFRGRLNPLKELGLTDNVRLPSRSYQGWVLAERKSKLSGATPVLLSNHGDNEVIFAELNHASRPLTAHDFVRAAEALIMEEVNRLSTDLVKLRAELRERPVPPAPPSDPNAIVERLRAQLDDVQKWMDDPSADADYARDVFRSLIEKITLTPVGPDTNLTGGGDLQIEIEGTLANLLTASGESVICMIQSKQFQQQRLGHTESRWHISGVIPGDGPVLGGAHDVIAVLRVATGSLSSEAVKNLVIERRGQVLTPAQTRQIASRVADILKYLRQRGVVHDVTPAGRRYQRLWVLAERADELVPLAPTPVLQMTEETELALEILEGLTEAPTTKELARRVLHAKGEEPITEAKLKATAYRLKHMLLRCERAGVLQNVATCHARGNEWVLVEGWRSKYVPLVKMPLQAKAAPQVGAMSAPAE